MLIHDHQTDLAAVVLSTRLKTTGQWKKTEVLIHFLETNMQLKTTTLNKKHMTPRVTMDSIAVKQRAVQPVSYLASKVSTYH